MIALTNVLHVFANVQQNFATVVEPANQVAFKAPDCNSLEATFKNADQRSLEAAFRQSTKGVLKLI